MADQRSTSKIDQALGRRVRTRRLEIGMSQERLADLLGITFQQVQKYEKGVNRIAASRLFDIAAALDMELGEFFDGIASKQRIPSSVDQRVQEALTTRDGARLMSLYASIGNTKLRRQIVLMVETLANGAADA